MEYKIQEGDIDAKVFIDKIHIDIETMKQIKNMVRHPAIKKARIMPDCHRGIGCCVGFTSELTEKIVPNFVGGDIGCGILTYPMPNLKTRNLKQLESRIRQYVPLGSGHTSVHEKPVVNDEELNALFEKAQVEAQLFATAYQNKFGASIDNFIPNYSNEWLTTLCKTIGSDYTYDMRCLGTLGGGNHFIEVNENKQGIPYLTIHSGSRSFGSHVCRYHQMKIDNTKDFDWDQFDDEVKQVKRKVKEPKELKKCVDSIKEQLNDKRHPPFLEGEEAYRYFFDMIFVEKYAELNRRLMLKMILEGFGNYEYKEEDIIESIHNYIDFQNLVLRKGAISARAGEQCIISLNMRDGILLCVGKGNEDWNCSAAHGAGRVVPRQKAFQKFSMKQFEKEMKDVYSTSVVPSTLDECPMVYKDTELIKSALGPTVTILEQLRPLINVKGL